MQPQKVVDLVKRLEESLFKRASTKEENMDLSSLENRLLSLIKRFPLNNHSQQFSNINSFTSIGTMIPTPGMPRSLNSFRIGTSSVDSSVTAGSTITSSAVNSGGFLQMTNFPSGCPLANGYQQSTSNFSTEGPLASQSVTNRTVKTNNLSSAMNRSGNVTHEQQYLNQQRWLLFLIHARRCSAPEGKCPENNFIHAQNLLRHMERYSKFDCRYLRCPETKVLINDYRQCKNVNCPVCIPVKKFMQTHQKVFAPPGYISDITNSLSGTCRTFHAVETASKLTGNLTPVAVKTPEDLQPSLTEVKMEALANDVQVSHESTDIAKVNLDDTYAQRSAGDSLASSIPGCLVKQENVNTEKDINQPKQVNTSAPSENTTRSKSRKPKIKGVSMMELFTPEQVREHIKGLRQWIGQRKEKAEKNQAMEHSMSEKSCQLCAVEKLNLEPPPIYCTPCGALIKSNRTYYTIEAGDTRQYCCFRCYYKASGDTIIVDGTTVPKARMEKKRNDEETEEWWVQCDKCKAWQHQICALFNGRRYDCGQAEYTCPNCYIAEVERGERKPLPQGAVLGAKDLPQTILSDHIEKRLANSLKEEREKRAKREGKGYDEVPGAEGLVVRVVSSVDKKLEVKPRFLDIYQEENYPQEFPYKSKVLLLFQRIEGVEVCLFGMYVHEFGSECAQPNHRCVYLSLLDSVKYFRPEIKTVSGEALRTFVYHEILIGYLEYCKKRGFTSCYIWACHPSKNEDYILYCHPEIQKTPKFDKLREWYLSMLRKAKEDNIVVELTNLYDHFFKPTGECKAKVTAARLPYFNGDYWPRAAENMIKQLQQEGTIRKTITKRAPKASDQSDLSGNASNDLLLMHKLGEKISPKKEDHIMVHLQHACSHCCVLMVSGNRWECKQCENFQLCYKCYETEQKLEDRERHPINKNDKHALYQSEIKDVPHDTKDEDEILESEFFDTSQDFLSLCEENHYQYDTLRRAKHSSMMVLYHLHNPTAQNKEVTQLRVSQVLRRLSLGR